MSVGHVAGRRRRTAAVVAVTTFACGGLIALSPASPVSADPAPPTEKVAIELVRVNGSGCRKQTTAVAISPDNEAFTVTYSEYLARVGPGAKKKDARKDCKLTLRMSTPRGFTYAIARTDFRGVAIVAAGATAVERATYRFQGSPERVRVAHTFPGPFDDTWHTTDVMDEDTWDFGRCGKERSLTIDTELEVSAGSSDPETADSMMAMDSTDGSVSTVYRFVWRSCT